jgi:hypothetical protein
MMKIVALFLTIVVAASASMELDMPMEIKADSELGMRLLSEARSLEGEWTHTWVAGYSLKFEGCHHISQWNPEAVEGDDVRIMTKRLVRFKLCPTDFCDNNKGCTSGYGDYIIDMESYIAAWFEAKQVYQSFKCDFLASDVCQCTAADTGEVDSYCLYDCYVAHKMSSCMENPYGDSASSNIFDLSDYMTCSQLSDNFYAGPYCASQGGAIHLGVFTDESCTVFADTAGGRETYYALKGTNLPYGQTNIIDMDCMSCMEPSENNNDGDDADDTDTVTDACESIYAPAGKCESHLPYGTSMVPNNNACNYLDGIKIVRSDGTIMTAESRANKTGAVFIGLFTTFFVLLSSYVYYLKTKLDRASINIAE